MLRPPTSPWSDRHPPRFASATVSLSTSSVSSPAIVHRCPIARSSQPYRLDLVRLDDVLGLEIDPDAKIEAAGHDAMGEQGAG